MFYTILIVSKTLEKKDKNHTLNHSVSDQPEVRICLSNIYHKKGNLTETDRCLILNNEK